MSAPAALEELDDRILVLNSEILAIKDQLAAADFARQEGRPANRHWLQRARTALRGRRDELARVQSERAKLAAARRRESRPSFQDVLLAVVREEFDEEEWNDILDEARERHGASQREGSHEPA